MNWKKFFTAFIVVYLVGMVLGYLIHGVLLASTYEELSAVWRPDMNNLMWVQWVTALVFVFFFVYIFAQGYEGKGLAEGVRFALVLWAFYSIPINFNQYMIYPIPYFLVWYWLIADLVMFVVSGLLVAMIYKPQQPAAAAA